MKNLDFSDVYKFFVSIGVAVIVFGFTLPWLLLREKFDFYLKERKDGLIPSDSTTINELIEKKIGILISVFDFLPFISIFLLMIGVVLIGIGLHFWWKKQKNSDDSQELSQKLANEKQQLENEKLRQELKTKNPEEKVSAILEFSTPAPVTKSLGGIADMIEQSPMHKTKEKSIFQTDSTEFLTTAAKIEQDIVNKYQTKYQNQYDILQDKKIGTVGYDLILLSKISTEPDIILNINYLPNKQLSKEEISKQLDSMEYVYRLGTRRNAIPKIIIVATESAIDQTSQNLQDLITQNQITILTQSQLPQWTP